MSSGPDDARQPGGVRASDPPGTPSSDAELLRSHLAGDSTAFATLVARHRDRLWAVAVRTLGGPDEAGDALQDALLSAYRAAGHFRGEAAVTTWLHRIVVNACLDLLRRRASRGPIASPGAEAADPRDEYARTDTRMDVRAALATLPLEQRAALVLVDMHALPVAQAAEVLGVAEGTVKSRCARGRAAMRGLLDEGAVRASGQGNPGRRNVVQAPFPAPPPLPGVPPGVPVTESESS